MEKKVYIIPQSEVTNLGLLGQLMHELGSGSLPAHMAPTNRRTEVF